MNSSLDELTLFEYPKSMRDKAEAYLDKALDVDNPFSNFEVSGPLIQAALLIYCGISPVQPNTAQVNAAKSKSE